MKLNTKKVSEYMARVVDGFPTQGLAPLIVFTALSQSKINFIILWLKKTAKTFGQRPGSPIFQCWICVTKRPMEGYSFSFLSLLLLSAPLGAWPHCFMEGNKGKSQL